MSPSKNWFKELAKLEGMADLNKNPHNTVVQSPSPSFNFIFGNGWGIPLGYTACLYGPPKCGKSFLLNAVIGQLHKDDPEAIAIKFNTEFREKGQFSDIWGIDVNRYIPYEVSDPTMIFDRIEGPIAEMCAQGAPIKLIGIDSIQGIQGRMTMNTESIAAIRPGDHAFTVQEGLKRIRPILDKYGITLVLTAHVRENLQMGGNKPGMKTTKMAGSWGLKHAAEYWIYIDKIGSEDGRESGIGEKFVDTDMKDLRDNADKTAHKIYFRMAENSVGPSGRTGVTTIDYKNGIINTYEEIAMLGLHRNIVTHPASKAGDGVDASRYTYGGETWHGRTNFLTAVRDSRELQEKILMELKSLDLPQPKKE